MTTPTIDLVRPSRGWTAGGTLVELSGTGFRLPTPPTLGKTTSGRSLPPKPTVRVLFDGRPSPKVWVISDTILRCLTPRHPPSRFDEDGIAISNGTVDVEVQNLDDAGAAIAGALGSIPAAYSFVRPRLDVPGGWYDAAALLQEHLRDLVLENVGMNPGVEYDKDTGDFANFVSMAELPGIAITRVTFPTSEDDNQDTSYTEGAGDPSGHILQRRGPLINDMTATLIVVTNSTGEALNLGEIIAHVLKHHAVIRSTPIDPDDPSKGSEDLVLYATGPYGLSDRIGNADLTTADLPIMIKHILSDSLPGAPTEGLPESPADLPHEGTTGITMPAKRLRLHVAKFRP